MVRLQRFYLYTRVIMNKAELKEQLQDNLLAYFDGLHEDNELVLDGMCRIVIKTIDEHECKRIQ